MSSETGRNIVKKTVKVTTCNTGRAKERFDALVADGFELNGRQISVDPLKNEVKNDRYAMSCKIWGRDIQKINEQIKTLCESMLAYCISNNVGCSSVRFINETDSFVEGRRWIQCEHPFIDEEN
ncbi:hypothetical protein [Methanolobus vulcani]|uniref:Uncharacterized protein n=1 Tax=Methanolobus vulcani TaxID=38026 RepID=A0A7Z8P4F4_9EURY|nr:hypothetical protein [Methanolobus vulcani]TQD24388.1 hypothetical protein FKV42_10645 [Methanolobus vulcani]